MYVLVVEELLVGAYLLARYEPSYVRTGARRIYAIAKRVIEVEDRALHSLSQN